RSGISGSTNHHARELVFDLKPYVGQAQFRLRFAMDGHNGRSYEGFNVLRAQVTRFGSLERDFDFAKTSGGWSADGHGAWEYDSPQGVLPGSWAIPRDYHNPYTVGLHQVPQTVCNNGCLAVNARGFAEFDWTPDRDQAL